MKNLIFPFIYGFLIFSLNPSSAQNVKTEILQKQWTASWITVPDAPPNAYGVYLFRKTMDLRAKLSSFVVHISADNRYKLFVNEKLVSLGPARGDLNHWNFETVDIAPYLQAGTNVVAAQVWNEAEYRPEAQISLRTAFILQGATEAEKAINTDDSWKCRQDSSYTPLTLSIRAYYVAGPGELIDLARQPKSWKQADFDDAGWKEASTITRGRPKTFQGPYGTVGDWMLVPSILPQMELKEERFGRVAKAEGIDLPPTFPAQRTPLSIPPHSEVSILLDQTYLTNAYPTVIFSDGKGASLSLMYAEALYSEFPAKGKRDEVENKVLIGRKDSLLSDGTSRQVFTPLAFRTYRYVQLRIITKSAPLVLDDIYGTFTGFPFQFNASLRSDQPEMDKMLEIGWRTARLCAVETYMDCPYYEQLQYIGDARIQALVSLYNSGDDRLLRHALNLMDQSRQPEGVTLSRHPSYTPQYIPTFSLWYIGMLHDYARYGSDPDFVRRKLPGMRQILDYFSSFQQADGSLKNVPHWMFTDWVEAEGWRAGIGPMDDDGTSALLDLQLLRAYQNAAALEEGLGMEAYATFYSDAAQQLKSSIQSKYWDQGRKLFADRTAKDLFSQHANALAILTGIVDRSEMEPMAKRLLADTTLAPASIYFKYYLHQALIKAGLGNDYLSWLDKWRENIEMGLTTWAEKQDVNTSRSDCHAWGSSPNIEFFRTILGIDSDGLGFSKVKIEPHLGDLKNISGSIPHPNGLIELSFSKQGEDFDIRINLPKAITGRFVWEGEEFPLKAGENRFRK